MARGRLISKSLSTSAARARLHDVAGKLAEFCQALYPLIVAHADDFGRLAGDPFTIKHMVDPTSPRRMTDFALALKHLDEAGLITWYRVADVDIIQILKFDEHQPGLHKRSKSKFPGKQDASQQETATPVERAELPGTPGKFPEIPSELNRTELNRREEKGVDTGAPRLPSPLDLHDAWNNGTTPPIPKSKALSDERKRRAQARLKDAPLDEWLAVIARIEASDFCRGQSERGWLATFDWLLLPDTRLRVLEGKYDNRKTAAAVTPMRAVPSIEETQRRFLTKEAS